jgi:pullulanase
VFTSQGIPFFQAGEEMARTKQGAHNSYKSPDSINMLDWDRKSRYTDLVEYYQGLIQLRKTYPAFRLGDPEAVRERVRFLPTEPAVIGYILDNQGLPGAGKYRSFALFFNAGAETRVSLPQGNWEVLVTHDKAGADALRSFSGDRVAIPQKSALVLGTL